MDHSSHGGGHDMGHMGHEHMSMTMTTPNNGTVDESYFFAYPSHKGWLYLHILFMFLGWVVVLPLSISFFFISFRLYLQSQIAFIAATAVGAAFGSIYKGLTPDLYPNNAHSKFGYFLYFLIALQIFLVAVGRIIEASCHARSSGQVRFMRVPRVSSDGIGRHSRDSGNGGSFSLNSSTENLTEAEGYSHYNHSSEADEDEDPLVEKWDSENNQRQKSWFKTRLHDFSHYISLQLEKFLSRYTPWLITPRISRFFNHLNRFLLLLFIPLGFTATTTGLITASGIFKASSVFNGLAHWIKGGIFVHYGFITLLRYLGCFSTLGWHWPIVPSTDGISFETIESSLIAIYGFSNLFLEHLAAWGGKWTHGDLQHLGISFMFLGCGVLGLLVGMVAPKGTPNPVPALVVFLLGLLMGSHHQASALSSRVHLQWGMLLSAAAVLRGLTYVIYPRMTQLALGAQRDGGDCGDGGDQADQANKPSRPLTEILTSFSLIAGGGVFMASARDTVQAMENRNLDPGFGLTVVVGFTAMGMAWVTAVVAVGGLVGKRCGGGRGVGV
ncbi:hypothetical protein BZA77DRAFT_334726 [Pyronema omphalodes]|nr:hypothetical protein BZA77DRAFT_334726 [Pyronema omphalodes]